MIIQLAFLVLWLAINIIVVCKYTAKELYNDLWVEQNWFGRIAANLFYAPAWVIYAVVAFVVMSVYLALYGLGWLGQRLRPTANKAFKGKL